MCTVLLGFHLYVNAFALCRRRRHGGRSDRQIAGNLWGKVLQVEDEERRLRWRGRCKSSTVWGDRLWKRICWHFWNFPSFLGQHGSCSTAQWPVELSDNILQNFFHNLTPQTVVFVSSVAQVQFPYVAVRGRWRPRLSLSIARGFCHRSINWRLRETRVTSRQGRQTALSFLCDKIL